MESTNEMKNTAISAELSELLDNSVVECTNSEEIGILYQIIGKHDSREMRLAVDLFIKRLREINTKFLFIYTPQTNNFHTLEKNYAMSMLGKEYLTIKDLQERVAKCERCGCGGAYCNLYVNVATGEFATGELRYPSEQQAKEHIREQQAHVKWVAAVKCNLKE